MRFSTAAAVLGLPLLVSADVSEYQAQFQNYFDKIKSFIPSPSKSDPIGNVQAKAGSVKLDVVTLDNWHDVLFSHVKPGSTTPEETWLLVTGGNKTCFGHCGNVEKAFNQTVAKFAVQPNAPHMALLNCDHEPVLCYSWSAPAGAIWIFEMLPEPAPINIWAQRVNHTTVTSDDIVKLQKGKYKETAKLHDGMFHPFNGFFAQNHLSLAVGYALWGMNAVPSWMFMILISMFSRSFMGNRMNQGAPGARRPAAAAPAQ